MRGSTLRAARREWRRCRTVPLEEVGDDALCVAGGALLTPAELVADADYRRQESAAVGGALGRLPTEVRHALVHRSGSASSGRRKAEAMIRHPSVRPVTEAVPATERDRPATPRRAPSARPSEAGRCTPDPRGTWVLEAACRGMAPEAFFGRDQRSRALALGACASCPVQRECLLDALALPEGGGLRAGMGEKARRALCQRPSRTPHWRPRECPRDGQQDSPGTDVVAPHGRPRNSPRTAMERPAHELASGTTPLPVVASARRTDSPSVSTTWAWCKSRSTSAEAMVLSMSWSNPEGWRFDDRARDRRS